MYLINSKAPTRIDLAGGTLDIWPLAYLVKNKATVNVGINLFARCELKPSNKSYFQLRSIDQNISVELSFQDMLKANKLPLVELLIRELWSEHLPPLSLVVSAESPAGAGLGGSSSMDVAVANALWRARQIYQDMPDLSDSQKVNVLKNLEVRLIGAPTGSQDFWGALRGNINIMHYPATGEFVETLDINQHQSFANEIILCYTGVSRASATNNWQIFKAAFDRDEGMLEKLEELGDCAHNAALAAKKRDLPGLMQWSEKEWLVRKSLWADIETPETRLLDLTAKEAGAKFTRLCGAGGGGVMAIFAAQNFHAEIKSQCEKLGGKILNAHAVDSGAQVIIEGI